MNRGGKKLQDIVFKLSFAVAQYHLRGERNTRIFKHKANHMQGVIAKIEINIRACISSWRNVNKSDATSCASIGRFLLEFLPLFDLNQSFWFYCGFTLFFFGLCSL